MSPKYFVNQLEIGIVKCSYLKKNVAVNCYSKATARLDCTDFEKVRLTNVSLFTF